MLNPEEEYIRDQKLQLVRFAVAKLGVKYRRMIELRYFDELSYEEIAAKLEIPLGTVKAQLFRAKDLMYEVIMKTGATAHLEDIRRHTKNRKKVA